MIALLGLVTWAKRAALIGLALGAVFFYAQWQTEKADHATTRQAAATAALQSATDAAATTRKLQKDKDHALIQAAKRAQAHRADADHARTELDRLRLALATPRADPGTNSTAPATDRARPAAELLGQCAAALTDLAATADRLHADRMTLWDTWPRPDR